MDDARNTDPDRSGPRFGVLGPLLVRGATGPVAVPGARQRIALATLLLRTNQVVPLDDLVDNLWPDQPPATARDQVVNVMSALRRLLAAAGGQAARNSLVTQPSGYLLRIQADELDVGRLEALIRAADARSAAGRLPEAVAALRAALALYRGPALADVPGRFAAAEVRRLEELRLALVEKRMEAEFALGRHRDVLSELTGLVERHPLRERLRLQLMVALHAAGRTADALAVYRAGQRLMAQRLGLDPSAELRRLEQAIRAELSGGAARTGAVPAESAAPLAVPALPPDVAGFVGRTDEIAAIRQALGAGSPGSTGTAAPLIVVTGPPGIGKSALVARVGHLERANFPDGQLHVAPAPGGYADTSAVLSRMFTALGVPRDVIPDDASDQVRLYRSVTARRRLLIVLDDVAAAPHVRPLLPAGAGCAVLITSRRPLAGLAGVHRVRLGAPSESDSLALLAATAGDRVSADPEAARRIAALCGRLPLALRAAGTKVALCAERPLAEFADRLADPLVRLDELRTGDLDVRAALASGLRELPPELMRAAQRLAALDAPLLPLWTVGAVLGVSWERGADLADQLVEWEILEYVPPDPPAQPRYRFRELVKLCLRGLGQRGSPVEPGPGGVDRDHAGQGRPDQILRA